MRPGCAKTRPGALPLRTSMMAVSPVRGWSPCAALAGTTMSTVRPAAAASRFRWRDPSGETTSSTRSTATLRVPWSPALRGGCQPSTRPQIRDQFSAICTGSPPRHRGYRLRARARAAAVFLLPPLAVRFGSATRLDLRAVAVRDVRRDADPVAPEHRTPIRALIFPPLTVIFVTVTQASRPPYDFALGIDAVVSATFLALPGYGSPASPRFTPSCRWARPSASRSFTSG